MTNGIEIRLVIVGIQNSKKKKRSYQTFKYQFIRVVHNKKYNTLVQKKKRKKAPLILFNNRTISTLLDYFSF